MSLSEKDVIDVTPPSSFPLLSTFAFRFSWTLFLTFMGLTEDIKRVISNTMEMDTGNNPSGHNRMTAIVRNVRNGKNNIYWEIGFDTLTRV